MVNTSNELVVSSGERNFSPIVIVAREHVYESYRDVPVTKTQEVIQIAKNMTDVAPFYGKTFFYIVSLSAEKSRIYFFTVIQDVYEKCEINSLFVIPENLLYLVKSLQAKGENSYSLKRTDGLVYVNFLANEFSTEMLNTPVDNPELNFKSEQEVIEYWLASLTQLPKYVYSNAFNSELMKRLGKKFPLKAVSAVAGVSFMIYMVGVSFWLSIENKRVTDEISEQRSALNHVFQIQQELNDKKELAQQLQENAGRFNGSTDIWRITLALVEQNMQVVRLSFNEPTYSMTIKSDKATDAISLLSSMEQITQPQIDSPAIKSRGKELVSLSFQLNRKGGK